jgi:hypothetical protein
LRNVIALAFLALVLAFVAVEGASLVQAPSAPAALKGQSVVETGARFEATRPPSPSTSENFPVILFGPLGVAALCYLLARKRA